MRKPIHTSIAVYETTQKIGFLDMRTINKIIVVLADDGTMWQQDTAKGTSWTEIANIPQG